MKLLIVFAILGCALAATVPYYVPISTIEEAAKYSFGERIANGHPAGENQFPHQVSVRSPVGAGLTTCGGSLISPLWVVTAAHCTVAHSQVNLRFGTINLATGGVAQTSFNIINHAMYNPANLNNDISLVGIPTALTTSVAIQPVRLAASSDVGTSFADWQSIASGWGETAPGSGVQALLRWGYKRVIPNAQCAGVYGTGVVIASVVCTLGWNTPDQGACGGDSGGPLTVVDGGILTQIGVAAFAAAAGCNVGLPNGFTRTSHFVEWVFQHTGIPIRA